MAASAMATKLKFEVGQTVFVTSPSKLNAAPKGRYKIVAAFPSGDGPVRYRVKGDLEAFERVVDEGQLGPEEIDESQVSPEQ
jgi:hypothetical protein